MLTLVLIHETRRDFHIVDRLVQHRQAQGDRVRPVSAFFGLLTRGRIYAVNPAAVEAVPGARPKTQYAVDEGSAMRDAGFVAWISVFGEGYLGPRIRRLLRYAGLRHDVAHGAAFRAGAEQGSLRSAQHLDAIQVKSLGQCVVGIEADGAHLNRRIVDVNARR